MQDFLSPLLLVLATYPMAWIAAIFVVGLLVGSFLNVVIHRLPIMLEREWRAAAEDMLKPQLMPGSPEGEIAEPLPQAPTYNLLVPRSACPKCGALITAAQNIPVISYLALRGRCANCGLKIRARYPVIELATGVLSAAVAWNFGFVWYTGAALLLTWALIALSVIDFDHQLLPDQITLPLVWLGLLLSLAGTIPDIGFPVDSNSSIVGAVAGYLSLWSVYHAYMLLTGKEGMGYGDFKLLAAFGAWMGWQMLLPIILLSATAGSLIMGAVIVLRGRDHNIPFSFGPYLAVAGWIALMWGNEIIDAYMRFSGWR